MKRTTNQYDIYVSTISKLHSLFSNLGCSNTASDRQLSLSIAENLHSWFTCEGIHGLDRFKALSNYSIRAIMGTRTQVPPHKINRCFRRVIYRSKGSHLLRLYFISVLSIYRLVYAEPEYKVGTITSPFDGSILDFVRKKFWANLESSCVVFSKEFNCRPMKSFNLRWSISGSSGPNGSPAYSKFLEDTAAVCWSTLPIKLSILYWSLPVINREEVCECISDLIWWMWEHPSLMRSKKYIHSRQGFLSDKGGKTRVVAIVDILSQSLLKPVHDHFNEILRIIPQDGTFDQDRQRARVKSWSAVSDHLSSIDLSACTDRFPGLLQAWILFRCNILTASQALGWLLVIAFRSFTYFDRSEGVQKSISYAVGQPMGAYSSWPAMALSHHVLVQLSYKVTYPPSVSWFTDYALLGDDLVIRDRRVAETYKELIASLGMPYSPSKSFEGEGVAEFAKSLFLKGEDLKPFPLPLLQFRKNTLYTDAQSLVKELSTRGLSIDITHFLALYPRRYRKTLAIAVLLPSNVKTCFTQPFHGLWSDKYNTFENLVLQKRIKSFSDTKNIFDMTHAFAINDPTKSKVRFNPFLQIGLSNSGSYPVRHLGCEVRNTSPNVLVGYGWTAWDPTCWPLGLPKLSDRNFIPGPSWQRNMDDIVIRHSFEEMNRLMPGYFWPRCIAPDRNKWY